MIVIGVVALVSGLRQLYTMKPYDRGPFSGNAKVQGWIGVIGGLVCLVIAWLEFR